MIEFNSIVDGSAARTVAVKAARDVLTQPVGLFGINGPAPKPIDLITIAEYIMRGAKPRARPIAHLARRIKAIKAPKAPKTREQRMNRTYGGITFAGLLTVALIVLKLREDIAWPWPAVLAPLWVPATVVLVVIGLVAAGTAVAILIRRLKGKLAKRKAQKLSEARNDG